jgi:hypothetical protein
MTVSEVRNLMLPIRTRGQLLGSNLSQATEERGCESDDLLARARVDSGVALHDARAFSTAGFDGDEEPTAADVERQRAYADWLARFEPRKDGGGQRERGSGFFADHVDARPGERAA